MPRKHPQQTNRLKQTFYTLTSVVAVYALALAGTFWHNEIQQEGAGCDTPGIKERTFFLIPPLGLQLEMTIPGTDAYISNTMLIIDAMDNVRVVRNGVTYKYDELDTKKGTGMSAIVDGTPVEIVEVWKGEFPQTVRFVRTCKTFYTGPIGFRDMRVSRERE